MFSIMKTKTVRILALVLCAFHLGRLVEMWVTRSSTAVVRGLEKRQQQLPTIRDSSALITKDVSREMAYAPKRDWLEDNAPHNTTTTRWTPTRFDAAGLSASEAKCFENPLKSTQPTLSWWRCSVPFPDDDHTIHSTLPDEVNLSKAAFLAPDKHVGQLCNRLGIMAGMLYRLGLTRDGQEHVLALPEMFTSVAWALDRQLLSKATRNGVLLDCTSCNGDTALLRCGTLLYQGKLYDVSSLALRVTFELDSPRVFELYRPRNLGYMPWLVDVLQPKPGLKRLVENSMRRFSEAAKEKGARTIVGIHRRTMDRLCYQWFGIPYVMQCFGGDVPVNMQQTTYRALQSRLEYKNTTRRKYFEQVVDPIRQSVEEQVPIALTCNYTLEPHQVSIIRKTWKLWAPNGPYAFMIADDRQAPKGRIALENSAVVTHFGGLGEVEDPKCFMGNRHKKMHYMLADMYAMAISDLHMGMVISSCDDIVAIWRAGMGYPLGTSYPTACYDGYYESFYNQSTG